MQLTKWNAVDQIVIVPVSPVRQPELHNNISPSDLPSVWGDIFSLPKPMFVRSGLGPLAHKTFLSRKTKFIPFAASELEVKITKTKYKEGCP
jgi:hypothetical protein